MPDRSSESDSDFEQIEPQMCNVHKHVRASGVDLADAQETLADIPASTQHRAFVFHSPNRIIAEVPKALPVILLASKAAVKIPVAPKPTAVSNAQAQTGATAAPTDVERFRRVSTRTNKEKAPHRYSPSTTSNVTMTTVLLSLFLFLFLAAAVGAQDVIVLPKLGAVAEKI